ncbi:type II toxin-antitoxin system VapC family toxin [Dissulfuribacter thermophilus]|nr:type II toxin-antitoxin system VapC family toxin [Dissulfuribacter thermophilus]
MDNSILVDTNVLIYAVDADSQFNNQAVKFLSDSALKLFTTSKNISEFLVVLTRNAEIELSSSECLDILSSLLSDIEILYPTPISMDVFQKLVRKYNPRGLWIHDVEIASIGMAHGISVIATNNIADFKRIAELEVIEI